MALLSETQLIASVNKKIKGAKAKLGGDTEIRRILNESMGDLRLDSDLISAKRPGIPFLIYQDVYEYAVPADIDYDKGISIIPQDITLKNYLWERIPLKYFYRPQNPVNTALGTRAWVLNSAVSSQYDDGKNAYTFDFENSKPYLLLRNNMSNLSKKQVVKKEDIDTTGGGTWGVANDASGIRKDTQNFKLNASSIAFDSDGGEVDVVVSNSTFTAVDLSNYEDKGALHVWVRLPSTVPDSVTLTWGSSAAAYWDKAVTVRKNGLPFKEGWNLLEFDWTDVDTDTGTPDSENVDYIKVTITNSVATAQKGYAIDGIYARLGKAVELQYYSKHLVVADDGTRKERFTASSDTTILEEQEVNNLIEKSFEKASTELREFKDSENAERKYKERAEKLGDRFPSEKEIEGTSYHIM